MSHKKRVYISGRMTGLTQTEWQSNFARAEMKMKAAGYEVFNPALWSTMYSWLTYEEYLKLDLTALELCDAIYLQTNYEDSNGAKIELARAEELGLSIIYESEV